MNKGNGEYRCNECWETVDQWTMVRELVVCVKNAPREDPRLPPADTIKWHVCQACWEKALGALPRLADQLDDDARGPLVAGMRMRELGQLIGEAVRRELGGQPAK